MDRLYCIDIDIYSELVSICFNLCRKDMVIESISADCLQEFAMKYKSL